MIEIFGATRPQIGRSTNEDALIIGRDPLPYAAVCDGEGNALQAILDAAARTGRYVDMTVSALRIR